MITVRIEPSSWSKVADYYYDNVHWNDDFPNSTLDSWVNKTYSARVSISDKLIYFTTTSKRDWFLMRWL